MKYEISNEFLKVKADTEGAILWSVTDKDGFEYIWQGDDRYWNEHGANLFPYIARLWEKSYIFQGKTYHMDIHGFAKDSVFSCEKAGENELVFAMEDTRETLEQYPFHFRFEIRYLLEKNTLKVFYSVKNKDEKTMYFGIGGHPGFNIPMEEGLSFEDYELEFSRACEPQYADMPYVGFWHMPCMDAPYVCIEPWCSLPSRQGITENLEEQKNLISLEAGRECQISWTMEIL